MAGRLDIAPDRCITPATIYPITLAEAKTELRIDHNFMDAAVQVWLSAIVGFAEHATGRAFIQQGRRVTLDAFPRFFSLRPSVQSVDAVKYVDPQGQVQTLAPSDYTVDPVRSEIWPAYGKCWPAARRHINTVTVDYTCGYGTTAADVPDGIKLYIRAKLVEQFDPSFKPDRDAVRTTFIDRLLDEFCAGVYV